MKTKQTLLEIAAVLLIVLLVYASVAKLMDYQKFVVQINQSPMLFRWGETIAVSVLALELIASVLLVFRVTRLVGLYVSFTLLCAFTGYIIYATQFQSYIPCSCGGVLEHLSWTEHLALNLFFLALSLFAIVLYPKKGQDSFVSQKMRV
jgi:uncharacterized membrane protein YphA (DoxX/SURF4 family)